MLLKIFGLEHWVSGRTLVTWAKGGEGVVSYLQVRLDNRVPSLPGTLLIVRGETRRYE